MKTRPVTEELLHADTQTEGPTDRHKDANCLFRIFVNAPQIFNECY